MFLRRTERKKNGKTHHYWNVVENKRLDDGRVVQRHVLYLGEINSSQAAAWRKAPPDDRLREAIHSAAAQKAGLLRRYAPSPSSRIRVRKRGFRDFLDG